MKECGLRSSIQACADRLAKEGHFLGGPPEHFDAVGRHQLVTLLEQGLMPSHKVLDVGCGCLRGGYWCIQFLNAGCYFGIEPNDAMLELGKKQIVGDDVIRAKRPSFSNRDDFDFSIFGEKFDFVVARSVWTHAAPSQIALMLDQFVASRTENAVFLTSYLPATPDKPQYAGKEWIGRSHASATPGVVTYGLDWVSELCAARGLVVRELEHNILNQTWLRIGRDQGDAAVGQRSSHKAPMAQRLRSLCRKVLGRET
jgi:SAM-dependent methyltransferase